MSGNIHKIVLSAAIVCITIILTGCQDPWITDTKRNAIEQYMLATVIERITEKADFKPYAKKKVYMDYTFLAPQTDKEYIQGRLEMELARKQCIVVSKREEADIMIRPIVGVLATDHKRFLIGTPPLPIPMPSTSVEFAIPEVAFFKRFQRIAYGRMSFTIFNAKTLEPLKVIPYINSSAQYNNFAILLIPFSLNDMDMKDTVSGEFNIGLD
ncbi:MAG: hypothetical protein IKC08_10625 [Lentisphaeria bacterium]|nr:hypothetical protein [Lentisphaeria bacterium]